MFKNLILYRFNSQPISTDEIDAFLSADAFAPCSASQEKSVGWVPPRGEAHGAFLESVGGQWIAKLMTETKAVPGNVITKKAQDRAKQIEAATGCKPGKKEMRDIKEDLKLELLPFTFSKESASLVWIDPTAMLLAIAASSQSKADEVVTMLVKAVDSFSVSPLTTSVSPTAAMSDWLISQEAPAGFTVDRELELKAADESKATIKYGKHPLDIDEVTAHVKAGKLPTKLALTWDGRVSFVLAEGMQIKKIEFLDVVFGSNSSEYADSFDANVVIATGELSRLIPDLMEALGGCAK